MKTKHPAADPLARAIAELQSMTTWMRLTHGEAGRTTAASAFPDGRSRNRLWKILISQGYVADDGRLQVRLLDELEEDPKPIEEFYTYDNYDDGRSKGKPFVTLHRLNAGQRKVLLGKLNAGPRMLVVDVRAPHKQKFYKPGEYVAARDSFGAYSSAEPAVWTPDMQDKRDKGAYLHILDDMRHRALNWYLHEQGVLDASNPSELVPVMTGKDPGALSIFGGPRLGSAPESWEANLPTVMQKLHEDIAKQQNSIKMLKRLEEYVKKTGGWAAFLAAYDVTLQREAREALEQQRKENADDGTAGGVHQGSS